MRKIVMSLLFLFGAFTFSFAQKTTKAATTTTKDAKTVVKSTGVNKDGTPDMRVKANKDAAKAAQTKTVAKSTGVNKDGTPDMRLKANKDAAKVTTPAPVKVTTPAPVKTTTVAQPKVVTPDKVVGTDSKGRTIYEGPRGGRYYLTAAGNKEYIKQ